MTTRREGDNGLNILIISQYWAPENGVPQRRWTWLTGVLEEAGHNVTVIAPPPHYNRNVGFLEWLKNSSFRAAVDTKIADTKETVVRTGFVPSGRSLSQRILNQAAVAGAALWVILRRPGPLKNLSPDLVIGTVPALPTAVVTYIAAKRFRAPYLIDLRDAWPDLIRESERWNSSLGEPSLREKILRHGPLQMLGALTTVAINFSLRRANGILVTSSRLSDSLRQRLHAELIDAPRPIEVVRNVFPAQTGDFRKYREASPQGELRILYAGTLGRAQNLANAVEAARIAKQRGLKVRLRFVGAGAARQELVKAAREDKVSVDFSSKIRPEDLSEHYQWADSALVHLTDWKALEQAVPSKTFELMSVGLHISAVAAGETADLVEELGAGHTVPPESPEQLADLWQELIRNPEQLNVSAKGAEWVKRERSLVSPSKLLSVVESFDPINGAKESD